MTLYWENIVIFYFLVPFKYKTDGAFQGIPLSGVSNFLITWSHSSNVSTWRPLSFAVAQHSCVYSALVISKLLLLASRVLKRDKQRIREYLLQYILKEQFQWVCAKYSMMNGNFLGTVRKRSITLVKLLLSCFGGKSFVDTVIIAFIL